MMGVLNKFVIKDHFRICGQIKRVPGFTAFCPCEAKRGGECGLDHIGPLFDSPSLLAVAEGSPGKADVFTSAGDLVQPWAIVAHWVSCRFQLRRISRNERE